MTDVMYEYHNDLKLEYAESNNASQAMYRVLISKLNSIDKYERKLGKDILNWSMDDFCTLFTEMEYGNLTALRSNRALIARYVKFLEEKLDIPHSKSYEVEQYFDTEKLRSFVKNKDGSLITCYDYENLIANRFVPRGLEDVPGPDRYANLSMIERIFFLMFWHKTVETPNDIFDFSMDNIDLENYSIKTLDGTYDQLSEDEVSLIKKFKKEQEIPVEVRRIRKNDITMCGVIDIDEYNSFYTELHSDNLIHPVVGSRYISKGKEENRLKSKPILMRFGHGRVLEICKQLREKTGIDYSTNLVTRSRNYYDTIKANNLTLDNYNKFTRYALFNEFKGEESYTYEELNNVLMRMEEQRLRKKYK